MTIEQALGLLGNAGPQVILGVIVYFLWKDRNVIAAQRDAAVQGRIDDAKQGTTQMLAIAERVHGALEGIDTLKDRSSR